jgi:hypothetical protein
MLKVQLLDEEYRGWGERDRERKSTSPRWSARGCSSIVVRQHDSFRSHLLQVWGVYASQDVLRGGVALMLGLVRANIDVPVDSCCC